MQENNVSRFNLTSKFHKQANLKVKLSPKANKFKKFNQQLVANKS